jgi:hypothetical protein
MNARRPLQTYPFVVAQGGPPKAPARLYVFALDHPSKASVASNPSVVPSVIPSDLHLLLPTCRGAT